ncbi:MAG: hypothetical protein QOF77_417 [Solirubrobacteraceae bacterium]|nr:hypothetical protein [Solirubrobacteraceae bacterium]
MLIAGGLAGCGATSNSAGSFKGDQAKVAAVVDMLSSASSSHDTTKICSKIFAPAVSANLKAKGGSCTSVVGKQLDTVDTFNLTVQSVTVTGTTAQARIKSTSNGKDKTDTLSFTRLPDGSWRIASLG